MIEAEAVVQNEGSDERGGIVSVTCEDLGKRLGALAEPKVRVVANTVGRRDEAREKTCVGGEGDRNLGRSPFEEHAARGEAVQIRGARARVAVGAEPIRPQGVDGDEEDVLSLDLADRGPLTRRRRKRGSEDRGADSRSH